jgi:hypothetical protein
MPDPAVTISPNQTLGAQGASIVIFGCLRLLAVFGLLIECATIPQVSALGSGMSAFLAKHLPNFVCNSGRDFSMNACAMSSSTLCR